MVGTFRAGTQASTEMWLFHATSNTGPYWVHLVILEKFLDFGWLMHNGLIQNKLVSLQISETRRECSCNIALEKMQKPSFLSTLLHSPQAPSLHSLFASHWQPVWWNNATHSLWFCCCNATHAYHFVFDLASQFKSHNWISSFILFYFLIWWNPNLDNYLGGCG